MKASTGRKALLTGLTLAALAPAHVAMATDIKLPPISVGAGLRTSFTSTNTKDPAAQDANDFALNSARLYLSGSATENIKFMFNTEYVGQTATGSSAIDVMDAVAQFDFSDHAHIWAGRFLPPSDRANLYGPYYANNWAVYADGVQDGYPFVFQGRANGAMYWGQFDRLKVSAGAFDVPATQGKSDVIGAARVQLDLWDIEQGYYLNGTYYGEKDLLGFGLAGQTTSNRTAWTADFLMEKNLGKSGVVGVESEYAFYNGLGGYDANYGKSSGWYGLVHYILPQPVGIGKVQFLAKYGDAKFDQGATVTNVDYKQTTSEFDINYLIKPFNARVSLYYKDTSFDAVRYDFSQIGLGLQVQM